MNTLMVFPCAYTIKIIGLNQTSFVSEVTALIAAHCESFNPQADIKTSISKNNNYLSISADIVAQSQQQLDDIYRTLNQHKLVKVTL